MLDTEIIETHLEYIDDGGLTTETIGLAQHIEQHRLIIFQYILAEYLYPITTEHHEEQIETQ